MLCNPNHLIYWIIHASPAGQKAATIKASFLTEFYEDGHVIVNYWYTSGDDRSLDFVRDISKYVEKLSDVIQWEPRFVTWACPHCDDYFKQANCVSDGKYCAMRHDEKLKISGSQLILEDLRQHCLSKNQMIGIVIYSKKTIQNLHFQINFKIKICQPNPCILNT